MTALQDDHAREGPDGPDAEPAEGAGASAAERLAARREAVEKLSDALKRLEAAVNRRATADRSLAGHADVIQRLEDDRAELARRLDRETARAERLEAANREVSGRLVLVMERVRRLLGRTGEGR